MTLLVVVPTLNEVHSLGRLVAELRRLEIPGVDVRVLIVDDASTDGTARLADELAATAAGAVEVIHRPSKTGLGSAYVDGFTHALAGPAEWIAQMDADLSHDPAALIAMLHAAQDADLVIGSRYLPGGSVFPGLVWHRRFMSWCANRVVVPALLGLPVTDATSGYRLWRRSTLARIAPSVSSRASGYGFQVEMVFLAHQKGCRVREVPIVFHMREGGASKMSARAALATVSEILAVRRRCTDTAHPQPVDR